MGSTVIEIPASELAVEHLDKVVSAAWRDCWMVPVRLKTFESVTDAHGRLIQRTIVFDSGTITTRHPERLKVRIWP